MKINDEMRNGIPWEAIEDYYEMLEESEWFYFHCSDNVSYEITSKGETFADEKLLTKKLYKKCVD
tara:strand:+ start:564 stop:758 length:195 start_codon:yes stop_codon:yes gene_type:complete